MWNTQKRILYVIWNNGVPDLENSGQDKARVIKDFIRESFKPKLNITGFCNDFIWEQIFKTNGYELEERVVYVPSESL